MRFESPLAFLLLLALPLLIERSSVLASRTSTEKKQANIRFSSLVDLDRLPKSLRQKVLLPILNSLLALSWLFLVFSLARPQTGTHFAEVISSGRDLMLVLDVSGSMEALDFQLDGETVTRLSALKHVTRNFVENRKGDRVGLILFGSNAFTQCPLTQDHSVVMDFIDSLETGMVGEGTALGDAIAVGTKRIRDLVSDSKVLVLVTDGMKTAGDLDPLEATKIAQELKIKIYTIGVGGKGKAPFRTKDLLGREVIQHVDVPLDEKTLTKIAEMTGGKYFHAADTNALKETYKEIEQLERRDEQTLEFIEYKEWYLPFLLLGLSLFCLAELLRATVFLRIP